MSNTALLSGDADAIKDFVFESSSLPQIRGASELLMRCEDKIKNRVKEIGGRVIYCGGGSFLIEVPVDKADLIAHEIERIYLDETMVATATVVYESAEVPSCQIDTSLSDWASRVSDIAKKVSLDGTFAHRNLMLAGRLREAKTRREYAPFYEAVPFGKRCETCGKRVAVHIIKRGDPESGIVDEQSVCPVCKIRHETGLEGGHGTRGRFNKEFEERVNPKAKQPQDLEDLVKSARAHKYLSLLYADGNDIGNFLGMLRTEREFEIVSEALRGKTKEALFSALAEVCREPLGETGKDAYWPFEIVNIGGDDVTVLVQAGYVWDVAVKFLKNFEYLVTASIQERLGKWPKEWPSKLTASCGIVIADCHYPIRQFEKLVSASLRRAKALSRKCKPEQSALDFMWMPSPIMADRMEPILAYYERDNYWLTARPYTLAQAEDILGIIEKASKIPRTQRRQWAEALDKGTIVSLSAIYYSIARSSEEKHSEMLHVIKKVGELIEAEQPGYSHPLWKESSGKRLHTALLDVLELAELRATRGEFKEEED